MKGNNFKIKNTLGMFDLLKGIIMVAIIAFHTFNLFFSTEDFLHAGSGENFEIFQSVLAVLFIYCFSISMPAFLVVSGYGFRKRPFVKMLKQQAGTILIPYFCSAIAAVILHLLCHYLSFRYLPGAINETLKIAAGQVFGMSKTVTINNFTLFACGTTWFLLTLFWAYIFLDFIMLHVSEKKQLFFVGVVVIVGWILSFFDYVPWCISQGMVGTLYVYMGHAIKKRKIFEKEWTLKEKLLIVLLVIIPGLVMSAFGCILGMADGVYSLGVLTIIVSGFGGCVLVYFYLKNNIWNGKISNILRGVGRYSLYIMCVHSVELIAIPWYIVSAKFQDYKGVGFVIIFALRFTIDYCLSLLINCIRTKTIGE